MAPDARFEHHETACLLLRRVETRCPARRGVAEVWVADLDSQTVRVVVRRDEKP